MVEMSGIVSGKKAELANQAANVRAAINRTEQRIKKARTNSEYSRLQSRLRGQRQELRALEIRIERELSSD